jgi:hypothetical protein
MSEVSRRIFNSGPGLSSLRRRPEKTSFFRGSLGRKIETNSLSKREKPARFKIPFKLFFCVLEKGTGRKLSRPSPYAFWIPRNRVPAPRWTGFHKRPSNNHAPPKTHTQQQWGQSATFLQRKIASLFLLTLLLRSQSETYVTPFAFLHALWAVLAECRFGCIGQPDMA